MPVDGEHASLGEDTIEAPAEARTIPERRWQPPVDKARQPEPAPEPSAAQEEEPQSPRRRWLRWALFLVLPGVLIVGAYFYFEGGAVMSTNDAYIQADEVGLSTDVSGMVKAIEVKDNQHVKAGQALFRLDPASFQFKLDQAQAQLGNVRDELNTFKANYRDVQAQIKQAEAQIAFNQLQFERQQILARKQVAPQTALDQARLNLLTAQQHLSSLKAQLASIVAKLNGDPRNRHRAASAVSPGRGTA